jgi:excinuclease ABC subunit A
MENYKNNQSEGIEIDTIFVKGAREHNLKNIDVSIPRNKLVVITGLSGSGKSSLAFDTIYAEGQRRYIESLSSYARQFLGQMEKPNVDYITGLSPAISIDQKAVSKNPRSTVGTVTEIYDYLRVLFARIGKAYCPIDGERIQQYSIDEIVEFIIENFFGKKIKIFSSVIRGRKGEYISLLNDFYKKGYEICRIDSKEIEISRVDKLDRYKMHSIDILVDSITIFQETTASRRLAISQAIDEAVMLSGGFLSVVSDKEQVNFSTKFSCPQGHIFEELEPRLFSFNSPFGACPACLGLGYSQKIDPNLIVPDKSKTIDEGAFLPWSYSAFNYYGSIIRSVAKELGLKTSIPIKNFSPDDFDFFLNGSGDCDYLPVTYYAKGKPINFKIKFNGLIKLLEERYEKTDSDSVREEISKYMSKMTCSECFGKRLKRDALSVKVSGVNIYDISTMSITDAIEFFNKIDLSENDKLISDRLITEIKSRLEFLKNVGLGYLTLGRFASTLSGGETQRIRLASQIGSGLMGVLYVLDEPSIGLHQKDNLRLLNTLKHLRDIGNTVIVIEHDEETIRCADWIIDMGPAAGEKGGEVVAQGTIKDILKSNNSSTARYLNGSERIPVPEKRRKLTGKYLSILDASENNLKNLNVRIPTENLIVVTGVSGSGKSTLVNEVLFKGLQRELGRGWEKPGRYKVMEGKENFDKIICIDQSPIGRTPRSNPATYTKSFDIIRELFASTKEAKVRGYKAGRFSFNVPATSGGGRCEKCRGDGFLKIEMHFLPDVFIPCDVCHGGRYNNETLEVKYKDKSVADVLAMSVDEAAEFFSNIPILADKLKLLQDVGLGYIRLGQSATTLSGGEAQRIKLSSELSKRSTGKTLYILDEPTTGLHFEDVSKLLEVLNRLVDAKNTVVVIEHNLDVIKTADYVIDLGPEGGDGGGRLVAAGSPEIIAGVKSSYTGQYLKKVL